MSVSFAFVGINISAEVPRNVWNNSCQHSVSPNMHQASGEASHCLSKGKAPIFSLKKKRPLCQPPWQLMPHDQPAASASVRLDAHELQRD